MLKVGNKIPDFSLEDQDGKVHKLGDYQGKTTLFYFYPKDFTPGCTIEACEMRDNIEELRNDGLTVVGISSDTAQSHRKFADKHKLPFTLLSDPDKKLIKTLGVLVEKSMFGKKYLGTQRASFLIGPDLKIIAIWPKVKPLGHAKEVRDFLIKQK